MKYILFLSCFFLYFLSFTQKIHGYVTNESNEPLYAVKVSYGSEQTLTDWNGRFELLKTESDTLYISLVGYETKTILLSYLKSNNLDIKLHATVQEIQETIIKKNKFEQFNIGYLPPVKGVQIATGTNTIIQTENQSGAKSSANPRELFAKVPGINIWESDGAGIQMGVGGRGLSPNRSANFNMRQNGYDISADALGYPESYYTPPLEALSSIEIIRGSASLQYGTQFGGLMNFIIKDPVKNSPLEITFRNTLGNYGYKGSFLRLSGTNKRFEYQSYFQYKEGEGYRKNSGFDQSQYFAQLGYHINEKQLIRIEYTTMQYNAKQPGGLTDIQFNNNPTQSIRDRNWFKVNWNLLALTYNYNISNDLILNIRSFGILSSRQSLGFLGKINQIDPGGDRQLIYGDFKNSGIEARILKKYSLNLGKKNIKGVSLIGSRYYKGVTTALQGNASSGSDANFVFNNPSNLENSSYSFPSENIALFIENIWFLGSKWTYNLGVRYEFINSCSNGYYKQYSIHPLTFDTLSTSKLESSSSLNRSIPLFGTGISFKTTEQTTLYSNYCLNYRAINFNDIRVTNPNLLVDSLIQDEFGSTAELGFRGFVKPYFYADISLFHIYYGNKIGITPIENSTKKIRTNIGDARNYGLECFVEFDFIKALKDSSKFNSSIFVNFAYINAEYISSKETNYIGKKVEYVSPILFKSGLKFKYSKWATSIQGSYNSSQFSDASNSIEPSSDAVIGEIPSYFVMDVSLKYNFKNWMIFESGINNLLNNSYYTRRATAYPGPGILPSDGRYFYCTVQVQFGNRKLN